MKETQKTSENCICCVFDKMLVEASIDRESNKGHIKVSARRLLILPTYFTIQLIFATIYRFHYTFWYYSIYRSHYTISANFYLNQHYFQQKVFGFSKISGSKMFVRVGDCF